MVTTENTVKICSVFPVETNVQHLIRFFAMIQLYCSYLVRNVQSVSLTVLFFLLLCCSYYMDGRVNKAEDFLKTRLLDTLTEQISKVAKVWKFLFFICVCNISLYPE